MPAASPYSHWLPDDIYQPLAAVLANAARNVAPQCYLCHAFDVTVRLLMAAKMFSVSLHVPSSVASEQAHMSRVCANAGMRAIDLTCLLLAPIATGFLMTYTSPLTAVLAIAAWNMAAWAPECYLLLCARNASAALRR